MSISGVVCRGTVDAEERIAYKGTFTGLFSEV